MARGKGGFSKGCGLEYCCCNVEARLPSYAVLQEAGGLSEVLDQQADREVAACRGRTGGQTLASPKDKTEATTTRTVSSFASSTSSPLVSVNSLGGTGPS